MALEGEIARLGAATPLHADAARRAFAAASDLHAFVEDQLGAAEAGDRAAQYYVYLALEQCRTYLRLDAAEAAATDTRMRLLLNDRERPQWDAEHRRCRSFAGADLGRLRAAMGDELPGAETEYASVWFQRAALAGYPPALAEQALRLGAQLGVDERRRLLEEAVVSGDAEVYWLLFLQRRMAETALTPEAVAWLLLACRARYDCSESAPWFEDLECSVAGGCARGVSALGHYWQLLAPAERAAAWAAADDFASAIAQRRLAALPWPSLQDKVVTP